MECRYCGAQMAVLHEDEPDEFYCPACDSAYCRAIDEWSSEWDVWFT